MSLLTQFLERADAHPERTAIIEASGASISYGDLARRSARLAARLANRGVGKADRVLVAVWPSIDLYAGLAAIWRIGAVAVFPEPATGIGGLRHAASVARPKALLCHRWIQSLAWLLPETRSIGVWVTPDDPGGTGLPDRPTVRDGDPALISFTSGTSGQPKGIERSHGLMLAQHKALSPLIAPTGVPEIDLVAFPAFVLTCLGHGTTAVLPAWNLRRHDRVDPSKVIDQISRHRITRALIPPAVTTALAGHHLPEPLHRVLTGGGPVYPDIMRRFLDGAPSVGLTIVYGSTEAEPISHIAAETLDASQWEAAANGAGLPVGPPVPEIELRIINEEIVVTGQHVVGGYLDPARDLETKIQESGRIWHRTGDAGRLDDQGCLWLLGRLASTVHGHHPFTVETAARLWPGVRAAALAVANGRPLLLIEGDFRNRKAWTSRAADLGGIEICPVEAVVMDRRHRSKPDIAATLARNGRRR